MPGETRRLRFARRLVARRRSVALALGLATAVLAYPLVHAVAAARGLAWPGPVLRLGSGPDDLLPDHPFVTAQRSFRNRFANSTPVVLCLSVREGTIFTPATLAKLDRLTRALDGLGFPTREPERRRLSQELQQRGLGSAEIRAELDRRFPPYPVNHDQVRSLTHEATRLAEVRSNGDIETEPLIPRIPESQEQADALRARVLGRSPEVLGRLVSEDQRAALVFAGFVSSRLDRLEVYRAVFEHLEGIRRLEEDADHAIYLTGAPLLVGWLALHLRSAAGLALASLAAIFALVWLYFRRWHGIVLPLVAAAATTIWGVGWTAWLGLGLNPLLLVVPMLITARAISHTVQMADRFFEEYAELRGAGQQPEPAKREAAARALAELVVPGSLGVVTDAAGLLAILITSIPALRELGLSGAVWVVSMIFTVELLHPTLIALLPAPALHVPPRWTLSFLRGAGALAAGRRAAALTLLATAVVALGSGYVALTRSRVGEASAGSPLLWPDHPWNRATAEISRRFGAVESLVVYVRGSQDDSVALPESLRSIEAFERWMGAQSSAAHSVSLVPLLRGTQRALRYDDPKFAAVPGFSRELLEQIRFGSPPQFLRSFVSDDGRAGTVTLLFPDHTGDTVERALGAARYYIDGHPTGELRLRLGPDEEAPESAWTDALYYALGPVLPPRPRSLHVWDRDDGGRDRQLPGADVLAPPGWLERFRGDAVAAWRGGDDASGWPARLEAWRTQDATAWWASPAHGVEAVVVRGRDLLVRDLREPDAPLLYQPTASWTRGVELVLAGGTLGSLAAVNEEVERGHVANTSLILLTIFVLHTLTYRSLRSGLIVTLQLAVATLFCLGFMALRGVPLNIHTLPVQTVGIGIGVDYAIYLIDRLRAELRRTGDIDLAVRAAVSTTGVAVVLTAATVVAGLAFWTLSPVRFQAEMAFLLALLMVSNAVGAVVVVPALFRLAWGRRRPGSRG